MPLTLVLIVWFQVSQLLTLDKYQNIEKVCLVVLNCRYNKQTTRIPDHSCPVLFENPQSVQFRLRQTTNATLPVKPFITAHNTKECWDRFMILFALIQAAKFSLSHRYIQETCTQNKILLVYLDSISVSVFVLIFIELDKYWDGCGDPLWAGADSLMGLSSVKSAWKWRFLVA